MSTGSDDLFTYAIVGVGAGFWYFFQGFKVLKQKRLIENTPTSKVRSLAMGQVEVFGQATPWNDQIFQAHFSKQDCVYSRYTVEELVHTRRSAYWKMLRDKRQGDYFYLQDDTGQVLISTSGAEMDIPHDFRVESGLAKSLPPEVQEFLVAEGLSSKNFLGFTKKLRYTEYFLSPGDRVYVLGVATNNPFVKDGTATSNEMNIMIGLGPKGTAFYISDRPEKECLQSFSKSVLWKVYGGATLTVISLIYILYELGL